MGRPWLLKWPYSSNGDPTSQQGSTVGTSISGAELTHQCLVFQVVFSPVHGWWGNVSMRVTCPTSVLSSPWVVGQRVFRVGSEALLQGRETVEPEAGLVQGRGS